jgi:hypothetical protein
MRYPNGLFGWVDLSSTDVDASKAFYSGLFGWELEDVPTPMGPSYTMCRLDGAVVAGLGPQPPGMAGMPSIWNSYLMVDDADATCAAVTAAGGSVLMPGMDVMTEGRMAMVADPSGAVVGLWQPRDMDGADVFNVPGSLTWNELQTRDLAAAMAFYASVFGWRWEEMPDSGGYQVAHLDSKDSEDTSNGGALTMPEMVPAEVPSYWAVYFAVEDCDTAVERATGLGAAVFLPAMQMGPGRFAGLTDPTGGMFMVGHFTAG